MKGSIFVMTTLRGGFYYNCRHTDRGREFLEFPSIEEAVNRTASLTYREIQDIFRGTEVIRIIDEPDKDELEYSGISHNDGKYEIRVQAIARKKYHP